MGWMMFLFHIAAGSVRVIAGLFFVFHLVSGVKPGKASVAAALGAAAVIQVLLSVLSLPDFYRVGLEALLYAACIGRIQKKDVRMSLFVGIFYEIAVLFWQFLFAAWLGVLFRSPEFLESNAGKGQIAVWLCHGLLAVFLLFSRKWRNMSVNERFRYSSGVVAASFVAVITLSEQKALAIEEDTLDMWTLLAVVLMMSVLVYRISRQYETEKELARLKSEQAELLERDYTALNHAYGVNAKLFHDFHNHIGVLQQFLSHGNLDGAVQYLDELQEPVREMTDTVWTGDETIDYLINSKAVQAKSDGICLKIQVEFPRHINIRSADLCAIVGNFLDNAMEAARQVPEEERREIRLTIRRINQMLVIKTENTFVGRLLKKEGSLQTTKEANGLHGWGLKSAQTAAEKYFGCVQTSFEGGTFRAVATLSYEGAPRPAEP